MSGPTAENEQLSVWADELLMEMARADFLNPSLHDATIDAKSLLINALSIISRAPRQPATAAARDVLAERARQVSDDGRSLEQEDTLDEYQLAKSAAFYALCMRPSPPLRLLLAAPAVGRWWLTRYRKCLVTSGALILAEIERFDRALSRRNFTGSERGVRDNRA